MDEWRELTEDESKFLLEYYKGQVRNTKIYHIASLIFMCVLLYFFSFDMATKKWILLCIYLPACILDIILLRAKFAPVTAIEQRYARICRPDVIEKKDTSNLPGNHRDIKYYVRVCLYIDNEKKIVNVETNYFDYNNMKVGVPCYVLHFPLNKYQKIKRAYLTAFDKDYTLLGNLTKRENDNNNML